MIKAQVNILLLAVLALLTLSACESGAELKVFNRTSFPVFVRMEGTSEVAIPAGGEHSFDVETETQSFLTGTIREAKSVWATGETYRIYDRFTNTWTDSTEVIFEPGKTTKIYMDPNRASIKILNSCPRTIRNIEIFRHDFVIPTRIATMENLGPNQMRYITVNYSIPVDSSVQPWTPTPSTNYYYYAIIYFSDSEYYTYGGENTILYKDQQYLITHVDIEKSPKEHTK